MWITSLHIKNYKSLEHVPLNLNPRLNVFIGRNNTGKSNVLDALMLLKDISTPPSLGDALMKRGSIEQLVLGKQADRLQIEFVLTFQLTEAEVEGFYTRLGLQGARQDLTLDDFKKRMEPIISYSLVFPSGDRCAVRGQEKLIASWDKESHIWARSEIGSVSGNFSYNFLTSVEGALTSGNWGLEGSGSSPNSLLAQDRSDEPRTQLQQIIREFLEEKVYRIEGIRSASGQLPVQRQDKLSPDGSNLSQVLHTLSSGNPVAYQALIADLRKLVPDVLQLLAPQELRGNNLYLSVKEAAFREKEFRWEHVAVGTKELAVLITQLHLAPKESVLMLEEPEAHLHTTALLGLMDLLKKAAVAQEKQVFITTHSALLIATVDAECLFLFSKEQGKTVVREAKELGEPGKRIIREGVLREWLVASELVNVSPDECSILVVEGGDDEAVWTEFVKKSGLFTDGQVKVMARPNGGFEGAIRLGWVLKMAEWFGLPPFGFFIVADGDGNKAKREQQLNQAGFDLSEYAVLAKKEIESYLLDAEAVAKAMGKPIADVKRAMRDAKGSGKGKLKAVFNKLGLSQPNKQQKAAIARNMERLPEEIEAVLQKIKERLS